MQIEIENNDKPSHMLSRQMKQAQLQAAEDAL